MRGKGERLRICHRRDTQGHKTLRGQMDECFRQKVDGKGGRGKWTRRLVELSVNGRRKQEIEMRGCRMEISRTLVIEKQTDGRNGNNKKKVSLV